MCDNFSTFSNSHSPTTLVKGLQQMVTMFSLHLIQAENALLKNKIVFIRHAQYFYHLCLIRKSREERRDGLAGLPTSSQW